MLPCRTQRGQAVQARRPSGVLICSAAMTCSSCGSFAPAHARFCGLCGAAIPKGSSRFVAEGETLDLGWGRVVVGELLGEGGMGVVHRGWLYFNPQGPFAGRAQEQVAVKALHPWLSGRPHVRQLFLGEAEALRKLSHPNIVWFWGLAESGLVDESPSPSFVRREGTRLPATPSSLKNERSLDSPSGEREPSQLAIVMEMVQGEPLSNVIERHVDRARRGSLPALPFARAWHYFQQLLGALAATHQLGIVHRDVKPGNLLIRHDGTAKLTDFGIARLPADALREGDSQPGTGAYMAPEQVLGKPLDGRSDLYAAAIVLYEMITGRTPFEEPDRSEMLVRAMQVEAQPPPIRLSLPNAPAVLDDILARALAKNPDERYPTAIALGNAIRAALNLPDTAGWRAQQVLAANAIGIATPAHEGRGGTLPIPRVEADAMRAAVREGNQSLPPQG